MDEDIDSKEKINQGIEYQKLYPTQLRRLKTKLKWYKEAIIKCQNNDKELPLCLPWVILTDHELLFFVKHQPIYRLTYGDYLFLELLEPGLLSDLDFIHLLLFLPFGTLLLFKVVDLLILHVIVGFIIAELWLFAGGALLA